MRIETSVKTRVRTVTLSANEKKRLEAAVPVLEDGSTAGARWSEKAATALAELNGLLAEIGESADGETEE